MIATIEIRGKRKNGKRFVTYYTVNIYNGIAADYYDAYKKAGCSDLNVRIL